MPLTAYPSMLAGRGVPYLNSLPQWTDGDIWFVHSGRGSNNNDGRDPLRPRASIASAEGQVRANRGDIIVALEGHTETIIAAAGLTFDVAGVTLVGLGRGASRATINYTTAVGADMNIDAASIHIENILFTGGIDALTGPIDVNASDFTMLNCEWRDVTGQVTDCIVTDANADRMLIDGFRYVGSLTAVSAASGTDSAIVLVGCDNPVIRNSTIMGAFNVACIECRTTAVVFLEAYRLRLINLDNRAVGTAGVGIEDVITGSTGLVGPDVEIWMQTDGANITEAVTGATFRIIDPVYVVNANNEKGIVINWTASTD